MVQQQLGELAVRRIVDMVGAFVLVVTGRIDTERLASVLLVDTLQAPVDDAPVEALHH